MKINFKKLGPSFQPITITSWVHYLQEERQAFIKRLQNDVYNIALKSHFDFLKYLGKGKYGKVFICRHLRTKMYHAAKIIRKKSISSSFYNAHIMNEKRIMMAVRFPFTVNLDYFIEDKFKIIFVIPLLLGGELFSYLDICGKLNEYQTKFYTSQVILALEYLHFMNVLYRDLKPENVLLDHFGYIKLTDFGFCKMTDRTYTICGTPEYFAPEVLLHNGYGKAVDWWALGVFIYELLCGIPPFDNPSKTKLYENIINCNYTFPPYFSSDAKNLIMNLLKKDVTKRYGNLKAGVNDIKNHIWFTDISWLSILDRSMPSPYKPRIRSITDSSNFYEIRKSLG